MPIAFQHQVGAVGGLAAYAGGVAAAEKKRREELLKLYQEQMRLRAQEDLGYARLGQHEALQQARFGQQDYLQQARFGQQREMLEAAEAGRYGRQQAGFEYGREMGEVGFERKKELLAEETKIRQGESIANYQARMAELAYRVDLEGIGGSRGTRGTSRGTAGVSGGQLTGEQERDLRKLAGDKAALRGPEGRSKFTEEQRQAEIAAIEEKERQIRSQAQPAPDPMKANMKYFDKNWNEVAPGTPGAKAYWMSPTGDKKPELLDSSSKEDDKEFRRYNALRDDEIAELKEWKKDRREWGKTLLSQNPGMTLEEAVRKVSEAYPEQPKVRPAWDARSADDDSTATSDPFNPPPATPAAAAAPAPTAAEPPPASGAVEPKPGTVAFARQYAKDNPYYTPQQLGEAATQAAQQDAGIAAPAAPPGYDAKLAAAATHLEPLAPVGPMPDAAASAITLQSRAAAAPAAPTAPAEPEPEQAPAGYSPQQLVQIRAQQRANDRARRTGKALPYPLADSGHLLAGAQPPSPRRQFAFSGAETSTEQGATEPPPALATGAPIEPPGGKASERMLAKGYQYVPLLNDKGEPSGKAGWRESEGRKRLIAAARAGNADAQKALRERGIAWS